MRKLLLFIVLFGCGLGILMGISYLRRQQRIEQIPDTQEGASRGDRGPELPFTPIPGGAGQEMGTGQDGEEAVRGTIGGHVEFTVFEEGERGNRRYHFDALDTQPLEQDRYAIKDITAHTYNPETNEVRSTLVAKTGTVRIEWTGNKLAIGKTEKLKLYDAVVTLHEGVPFAPLVLYMPECEVDLPGDELTSQSPVRVEGVGIEATSTGVFARYRTDRLRLVKDGHVEFTVEDGSKVELMARGGDPIYLARDIESEVEERIRVSVTDGGRVITHGERELTLDGRQLVLFGEIAPRDTDGDGIPERTFVPGRVRAVDEVLLTHAEGRFSGGVGIARFGPNGGLRRVTMTDRPVVGGWTDVQLEESGDNRPVYVELSGVGPLVLIYDEALETADLDLPGPAKIVAKSAEFELHAADKIEGRFSEHGQLDLQLRGVVTGTFQGWEYEGTDVDLKGTETPEGAQRLLAETETPAHMTGVDRQGNPVDINTASTLHVLLDRKELSVLLARDAVIHIDAEDPWHVEVGELRDLDVESGSFKASGGVSYSSSAGRGVAERARGYSRDHVELFGVPGKLATYDLVSGFVTGVDQGKLHAQHLILRPDFAHANDQVQLRAQGERGTQEIDCDWLEIRFDQPPGGEEPATFEFEAREVARCYLFDEPTETTIRTRFILGHGLTTPSQGNRPQFEITDVEGFGGVTLEHHRQSSFTSSGERFTWSPTDGARLEALPGERVVADGRFRPDGLPYHVTATWIEYNNDVLEGLFPEITLDRSEALPILLLGRKATDLHSAKADWMSTDDTGLLLAGNAHFSGKTAQGHDLVLDAGSIHVAQGADQARRTENIEDFVAWDGFVLRIADNLVGRGEILQADFEALRMEGRPASLEVMGFIWESENLSYDIQNVLITTDQGKLRGPPGTSWEGWSASYESLEPFDTPDSTIMAMRNPVIRNGAEELRGQWALFWVDRQEWIDITQDWLGEQGKVELPLPRGESSSAEEPPLTRAPTLFGRFNTKKISETLKEIYVEGNIEYLVDGETQARMEALYIDLVDGHGWLQGCELWMDTVISRVPTRLAVRADWLRHSADGSLHADHAEITACEFANPDYYIRTKNLVLTPEEEGTAVWDVRLSENALVFDNGIKVPLPPVHYKSDGKGRPTFASFRFGDSARFGNFAQAALNLGFSDGVTKATADVMSVKPREISGGWRLHASYFADRGLLVGTGYRMRAADKFWMDLFLDGIYDRGEDRGMIKWKKEGTEDGLRWLLHTRARYLLTDKEWFDFFVSAQSDPGAQAEFFEGQFVRYEKRDNYLHYRKVRNQDYYSAIAQFRANSFRNYVERLPDLGWLHGLTPIASVASMPMYYTATVDAAYLRKRVGTSTVLSPFDPDFAAGSIDRETLRADTRHRAEVPFDSGFGGVRLTPYASVAATAWSEGEDASTSPYRGALVAGLEAQTTLFRNWSHDVVHGLTPSVGVHGDLASFEEDGNPMYLDPLDAPLTGQFVDLGIRSRWRVPGGARHLDIALTQSHGTDVPGREDGWLPLVVLADYLAVIYGVPVAVQHDARYDWDQGDTPFSYTSFSFLPWDHLGFEVGYHRGLDDNRDHLFEATSLGARWEATEKWEVEGHQTVSRKSSERLASSFRLRRKGHDFIFELAYTFRQGEGGNSVSFGLRPRLGWRPSGFGKMRTLQRAKL